MRKIKSTALLGAFAAIAGVMAVSHEAGAVTLSANQVTIAKEIVPGSVSVNFVSATPVTTVGNSDVFTFTLNGASFLNNTSYYIVNGTSSCTTTGAGTASITFTLSNCSALNGDSSFTLSSSSAAAVSFSLSVPQSSSSVIIIYSSNIANDTPSSATLATIQQQFSAAVSNSLYTINPSSLTSFYPSPVQNSSSNYIVMYNNTTTISADSITTGDMLDFVFTGVPSSVTMVTPSVGTDSAGSAIPGNNSATIGVTLKTGGLLNNPSENYSFTLSNSGNIVPGNIFVTAYSVPGGNINQSLTYLNNQPFMTWTLGGAQIYVPDALVPDNNAIEAGYITISMPSSASIASIQILNNTSASCSTSGLLIPTGLAGQSYIDLSKLPSLCTGVSASSWQPGVPLLITISGPGVNPTNVAADGYAVIKAYGLKRLPADVVNVSTSSAAFSY